MLQEFAETIQQMARAVSDGMHTAFPAVIDAIDPVTGLAVVNPKLLYRKADGDTLPYPRIYGVPIIIPQASNQNCTIAFPVKVGDGCLVIISEQSLAFWRGEQRSTEDLRFDLTNAICIPGLFLTPNTALTKACRENAVVIQAPKVIIDGPTEMNGNVSIDGNLSVTGSYPHDDD